MLSLISITICGRDKAVPLQIRLNKFAFAFVFFEFKLKLNSEKKTPRFSNCFEIEKNIITNTNKLAGSKTDVEKIKMLTT